MDDRGCASNYSYAYYLSHSFYVFFTHDICMPLRMYVLLTYYKIYGRRSLTLLRIALTPLRMGSSQTTAVITLDWYSN